MIMITAKCVKWLSLPLLCVDCICLVKGFLAQEAICSVFRAELRWRHNKKGCSADAVECRLYSDQRKEQKT